MGEVCAMIGDCTAPAMMACAPAGQTATFTLFPGDTVCSASNNMAPLYVEVHMTGGTPACMNYSVSISAM
jgi:hypothetical protein